MTFNTNNSKVYFIEIKVKSSLKFSLVMNRISCQISSWLKLRLKHSVNKAFVFHSYIVSCLGNPAKDSAARQSKFFSR